MPDVTDLVGLAAKAEEFIKRIGDILSWKGNYPPATEHFPPHSIKADAGISGDTAWVQFAYADTEGQSHVLKVVSDLRKLGAKGGDDSITLDGQDVEDDEFTIEPVTGLENFQWYVRVKAEFKGTIAGKPLHARFDGPV